MERIPSIIDQYKAKNEVLGDEIPQLQEIAGKVWKKEDELKQLKSELAALDRKIQLERRLRPKSPKRRMKGNRSNRKRKMCRNRQGNIPKITAADTQSGG